MIFQTEKMIDSLRHMVKVKKQQPNMHLVDRMSFILTVLLEELCYKVQNSNQLRYITSSCSKINTAVHS
jgi:hypothetical protein